MRLVNERMFLEKYKRRKYNEKQKTLEKEEDIKAIFKCIFEFVRKHKVLLGSL